MKPQRSIKLNFIMNACLTLSSFIFPNITFPYVSRVLGPDGTGRVSFGTSVISYFTMFAQLGIPTYGIRACARVRDDKAALTKTAQELLIINLVMSIISYAVLGAGLIFLPKLREERTLLILLSSSILLNAIGMEWLYKALEQYTYITIRSIIFKFIGLGLMFLMVKNESDYVRYGFITIFAAAASYVLNFLHVHRYISLRPVGGYDFSRHLRAVLIFFAMACATTIYTHLDVVMLGFMKMKTDVGFYNAAVRIKVILVGIVTSLGTVLLPRASYYIEQGDIDQFKRISAKALRFVWLAATPMFIYFILYAPDGIYFLSGDQYAASIMPMRIIMPTLLLIGLTNILGIQILVPTGRERVVLRSEIAGAITDLVLNAILIPPLGASGAAIGTLAAEAVVLIVQYLALRDEVRQSFLSTPYVLMTAGIALGSAASLLVLRVLPLGSLTGTMPGYFIRLAVSAILYFGLYGAALLLGREPLTNEIIQNLKKTR